MWLFAGNICLQFGLGKIGLVGELVDWLPRIGKVETVWNILIWCEMKKWYWETKIRKGRGMLGKGVDVLKNWSCD